MNHKIWLSSPHMGGAELDFVHDAFDTNWIAPLGPNVDAFEADLATYLGEGVHVAALSSGTAALHLALIVLGVGAGDEVICQSMTFSASANPIAYLGATPVFVDSEPDTWNMSPEHLERALRDRQRKGKRVMAIIPVHLYGMPAKMDQIMAVAERYGVPVVEDAAEALGSTLDNRHLGTFGDMAILSFNGNKIITTSGGGALVSRNPDWINRARHLSTQARDPAPHYQHSELGYNYRLSNVLAGIGRGQMKVLEKRVCRRRANYNWYHDLLGQVDGIVFQPEGPGARSNRWLTALLADPLDTPDGLSREDLRLALESDNIDSRPLWKPLHQQPVFAHYPYYGEGISDALFNKGLCLPSGSNLEAADFDRIRLGLSPLIDSQSVMTHAVNRL
ncbi:MAG TPA: aminotransferase class I/II-fold pyridoxal phosphate-dependent enzyme [Dinghuibacter sp.]|uniref:DegT/DnrJ/EryC1/StrS family aminotransferase n=1 Tax=Dinghuibacter sp. TaxID=2024697 RepID=UPI002C7B393F|nr:aminotransferase class I/II-fold pyridoxal phosphate-dependent enzyme [Dinghuibacter sp.]HTJ10947.1 aminotransferase class I/II-fold pyridoxal phosphate-dependent enzyme [Dinghuibacter sp.]